MSLVDLYNNARDDSYAGKVRNTQESQVGAVYGVNFLDGGRKPKFNPTSAPSADVFQREFIRKPAGFGAIGGAQGDYPTENQKRYLSSTWTAKALKLPFEREGPPSLSQGFYIDRFRRDNKNNTVHIYNPIGANGYKNLNSSASAKVNLPPTS